MNSVWIRNAAVAHPKHRVRQEEAALRIGEANGDQRRTAAIAKGTRIEGRSVILPAETIRGLGSIEARNRIYQEQAPRLALTAVRGLDVDRIADVDILVTASCTGYTVPGWDVTLAADIGLKRTAVRLPITEAGCSGGVAALARATDYLRAHPGGRALVVAAEICSLAFHPDSEAGNLTSALLFGDGAGAALVETGTATPQQALQVVDSLSLLVPCSREALGFALTDQGFYPLLTRDLADLLPAPTEEGVAELLARNGLDIGAIGFWLVHPGGPRILDTIATAFGRTKQDMRWSWQSLREFGNTSSAAILDVTRRYLADEDAPQGWGVVIAFGPGVSIEILLVRRC